MGFWSRIAEFARQRAGMDTDSFWREWGLTNNTSAGVPVNMSSAMRHVAVMACTAILAEDVAKIPWQVFSRLPDGGKKPAKGHFLYRLLRSPNDWQTALEFKQMMTAAYVLRGNAYAVILRDFRGAAYALVPVHPDRVMVYEAPSGDVFYAVSRRGLHEMAALKSLPLMIHSDDIFHLRWMSSWNSLLGSSRVGLMSEAIGLAIGQEQMQARFVGQGARPGGALQTDKQLTKEVSDRLKAALAEEHGGWRNAGKTLVLEEGLKWAALGMTMEEADFMVGRNFSLEDIARGFRVPPYKLGIKAEGEGSSMVQQDQEYRNSVLSTHCENWKLKLEKVFDLDGDDTFIDWDYDDALKADIATRYEASRIAIKGSFKKINEIRRREGDPRDPKGDVLLQPMNMVPLGWTPPEKAPEKPAGPGSDTTGKPAEGGDGDALRLPGDDDAKLANGHDRSAG
jgi:HK97 family phage portal protein